MHWGIQQIWSFFFKDGENIRVGFELRKMRPRLTLASHTQNATILSSYEIARPFMASPRKWARDEVRCGECRDRHNGDIHTLRSPFVFTRDSSVCEGFGSWHRALALLGDATIYSCSTPPDQRKDAGLGLLMRSFSSLT